MNFFQAFNLSVFVGTLGMLIAGLSKVPGNVEQWGVTLWLFVGLFLLLRLKIVFDDHKYFASPKTQNVNFKVGVVMAVVSWFFWGLAGYSMSKLANAYFLVGVALSISTLWILAVALKEGATSLQYLWIGTNTLAILLLWGAYKRNAAYDDWVTWCLLGATFGLTVFDFIYSKSVPELER